MKDKIREIIGEMGHIGYDHGMCEAPTAFTEEDLAKATSAILRLVSETCEEERVKWKDHTDKFGVGVHAGIEAIQFKLKEE